MLCAAQETGYGGLGHGLAGVGGLLEQVLIYLF